MSCQQATAPWCGLRYYRKAMALLDGTAMVSEPMSVGSYFYQTMLLP
jgi:hypothetical protein